MKKLLNNKMVKKLLTNCLSLSIAATVLAGLNGCIFFLGNADTNAKMDSESIDQLKIFLHENE